MDKIIERMKDEERTASSLIMEMPKSSSTLLVSRYIKILRQMVDHPDVRLKTVQEFIRTIQINRFLHRQKSFYGINPLGVPNETIKRAIDNEMKHVEWALYPPEREILEMIMERETYIFSGPYSGLKEIFLELSHYSEEIVYNSLKNLIALGFVESKTVDMLVEHDEQIVIYSYVH